MDMDISPESSKCNPEFVYSVTEEFLKKIEEALESVMTKLDTYIDPHVLDAIMNDPEMNNLTLEELQLVPPAPSRIIPGVLDDDDDDVMVDEKLVELDFKHQQLMQGVSVVSMSIDYMMVYYKMRGKGCPPRYDEIVSTLECFVKQIDVLEKSYTEKLGNHPCDILSADNACLDKMIHKFHRMKLRAADGTSGGHQQM